MDNTDRRILRTLQRNGRISNQDLADEIGLSPSPCLRRLRQLEADGWIAGYAGLIDRKACGLAVTAFVMIRLQTHAGTAAAEFEQRVAAMDEVLQCHLVSGVHDYLLEVVAEDLEGYENFLRHRLHALPNIAAIETSFSVSTVKRTTACPVPAAN